MSTQYLTRPVRRSGGPSSQRLRFDHHISAPHRRPTSPIWSACRTSHSLSMHRHSATQNINSASRPATDESAPRPTPARSFIEDNDLTAASFGRRRAVLDLDAERGAEGRIHHRRRGMRKIPRAEGSATVARPSRPEVPQYRISAARRVRPRRIESFGANFIHHSRCPGRARRYPGPPPGLRCTCPQQPQQHRHAARTPSAGGRTVAPIRAGRFRRLRTRSAVGRTRTVPAARRCPFIRKPPCLLRPLRPLARSDRKRARRRCGGRRVRMKSTGPGQGIGGQGSQRPSASARADAGDIWRRRPHVSRRGSGTRRTVPTAPTCPLAYRPKSHCDHHDIHPYLSRPTYGCDHLPQERRACLVRIPTLTTPSRSLSPVLRAPLGKVKEHTKRSGRTAPGAQEREAATTEPAPPPSPGPPDPHRPGTGWTRRGRGESGPTLRPEADSPCSGTCSSPRPR